MQAAALLITWIRKNEIFFFSVSIATSLVAPLSAVHSLTHSTLCFQVHTVFQRCSPYGVNASCTCAVAVQSGDDVFVISRCRLKETREVLARGLGVSPDDIPAMVVRLWVNGEMTQNTSISTRFSGKQFDVSSTRELPPLSGDKISTEEWCEISDLMGESLRVDPHLWRSLVSGDYMVAVTTIFCSTKCRNNDMSCWEFWTI